jgi:hypothetical protein
MKAVRWNHEKAQKLKQERGIELESIAIMIEEEELIGVIDIPSRPNQKMFLVDYDEYIVSVPFVENRQEIFIKTAYRNRKINRNLKGENDA